MVGGKGEPFLCSVVALVLPGMVFVIGGLAVIAGSVDLNFRRVLGGQRGRPSVKPLFAHPVGAVAASPDSRDPATRGEQGEVEAFDAIQTPMRERRIPAR